MRDNSHTERASRASRNLCIRLGVAAVWACVVGGASYAGYLAFEVTRPSLCAIMTAAGAALYVVFFAGGP